MHGLPIINGVAVAGSAIDFVRLHAIDQDNGFGKRYDYDAIVDRRASSSGIGISLDDQSINLTYGFPSACTHQLLLITALDPCRRMDASLRYHTTRDEG